MLLPEFNQNEMNDLLFRTTIQKNYIHIRIQQRTGRKHITIIEGLPADLDLKKICSTMQKSFSCGGQVITDEDDRGHVQNIITLSGDQRQKVNDFLLNEQIADKECIKIHGY